MNRYTKHRMVGLLLAVLWVLGCIAAPQPGYAAEYDASLVRVVDEIDMLTSREESKLSKRIEEMIETADFDLVIVLTQDYPDADIEEFCDRYYIENEYGCGSDRDGAMIAISLGTLEAYHAKFGRGTELIGSDESSEMFSRILPKINDDDDYYKALDMAIDFHLEQLGLLEQSSVPSFSLPSSDSQETRTVPPPKADGYYEELPRVVDDAGLLTESEEKKLEARLRKLIGERKFDLAIVTVNSFPQSTIRDFADDYFDYQGYGYGSASDGALFAIAMNIRESWISTHGYGLTAFTDAGIEHMLDEVVPYLSDGDYYRAFDKLIDVTEKYLEAAASGTPYDPAAEEGRTFRLVASIVVSFLVSGIVILIMIGQMRNVARAQHASQYAVSGVRLTHSEDVYIRTSVVKTRRQSSSSSGGSSSHTSSSGRSHGGGGRSF